MGIDDPIVLSILAITGPVGPTGQSGPVGSGVVQTQLDILSGFTTGISGALGVQIAASSLNLTLTGQTLTARDALISGLALTGDTNTGAALYGFVVGLSGATTTLVLATGQAAINQANSVGATLSGSLGQTGTTLYSLVVGLSGTVNATGQAAVSQANGVGISLSGSLGQTGANLYTLVTGVSGVSSSSVAQTGSNLYQLNLVASGTLKTLITGVSSLTVSGSSIITGADISGAGGTTVLYSGGKILISSPIVPAAPRSQLALTFNTASGSYEGMLNAAAFFGSTAAIVYADLSLYTGVSLVINKMGVSGASTGALYLGYLDQFSVTPTSYLDVNSPPVRYPISGVNMIVNQGFTTLIPAARSGVYVALIGASGNGVNIPDFGNITAYFTS